MSSTGEGMMLIPMFPPYIEFPVIGLVVEISSESVSWIVIAVPAKTIAMMIKSITLLFVNMV